MFDNNLDFDLDENIFDEVFTPKANDGQNRAFKRPTAPRAMKRKFPGPAGLLPENNNVDTELADSMPDFMCSQSSLSVFQDVPWMLMCNDFKPDEIKCDIERIKTRTLLNQKVPFLAAIIKSIECKKVKMPTFTLKDPTGEIQANVSHEVYEEHANDLTIGSVIVLKQCSVFSVVKNKNKHLTITSNNVVAVYNKERQCRLDFGGQKSSKTMEKFNRYKTDSKLFQERRLQQDSKDVGNNQENERQSTALISQVFDISKLDATEGETINEGRQSMKRPKTTFKFKPVVSHQKLDDGVERKLIDCNQVTTFRSQVDSNDISKLVVTTQGDAFNESRQSMKRPETTFKFKPGVSHQKLDDVERNFIDCNQVIGLRSQAFDSNDISKLVTTQGETINEGRQSMEKPKTMFKFKPGVGQLDDDVDRNFIDCSQVTAASQKKEDDEILRDIFKEVDAGSLFEDF